MLDRPLPKLSPSAGDPIPSIVRLHFTRDYTRSRCFLGPGVLIGDAGLTMKLNLAIDLEPNTLGIDVTSFLASVRFILRGMFPGSKLRVTLDKKPSCKPVTRESTPPPPH